MVDTIGPGSGERQIPERYRFFQELEKVHQQQDALARQAMRNAIDPDYENELEEVLAKLPPMGLEFEEKTTPIKLEEADMAKYHYFFSSRSRNVGEGPFVIIGVSLYSDKSPYAFEADIEQYGDETSFYNIVATAEFPPFIVHARAIDKRNYYIYNYLEDMRKTGEKPRFLDDQACATVLEGITGQTIDIIATADAEFRSSVVFDHFDNLPKKS